MPNRIIREGINSSSRINALSLGAEVLYRRLMSVADDYGRYYGTAAAIRGACWPTAPKKVTEKQIEGWLRELQKKQSEGSEPLVFLYVVGGCSYLQISDFGQQIRSKSKFPEHDINLQSDCQQVDTQLLSTSRSRSRNAESESESLFAAAAPGDGNDAHSRQYQESWLMEPWPSLRRFVAEHNAKTPDWWPQVNTLSDGLAVKIKQYLKQFPDAPWWDATFANLHRANGWLRGYHNKGLGWLLQRGQHDQIENCAKVHDGKFLEVGR